jgi:hypothetical protein
MSKPEWSEAPAWSQWLAQDANGLWVFFENKPYAKVKVGVWVEPSPQGRFADGGGYLSNSEWESTLEARP